MTLLVTYVTNTKNVVSDIPLGFPFPPCTLLYLLGKDFIDYYILFFLKFVIYIVKVAKTLILWVVGFGFKTNNVQLPK
jgi:hypothetical protein